MGDKSKDFFNPRFSVPCIFQNYSDSCDPGFRRAAENGSNSNSSEVALWKPGGAFGSFPVFPAWRNGAAITTVDHADIRGLVTACLAFVVELPLATFGSSARWPILQDGSRVLPPGPRPPFQETLKSAL